MLHDVISRSKSEVSATQNHLRHLNLERFSFECRKVIGFAFATLHNCLKKFAPIFHLIRSKTKTNRDSRARVLPRFASATCNIVCVLCGWLEQLLWFWFYDTQLKTTLSVVPWLACKVGISIRQNAVGTDWPKPLWIFIEKIQTATIGFVFS